MKPRSAGHLYVSHHMNSSRLLPLVVLLLVTAAALRLMAMTGFSFSIDDYSKVLEAYFRTQARKEVFLGQYAVIAFALFAVFFIKPEKTRIALIAAVLFCLVSIARHFAPIFLVSNIGDYLVIGWAIWAINKKEVNVG